MIPQNDSVVYLNLNVKSEFPTPRQFIISFFVIIPLTLVSIFFWDQALSDYLRFEIPRWLKVLSREVTVLGRAETYYFIVIILVLVSHLKLKFKNSNAPVWGARKELFMQAFLAMSFTSLVTILLKIAIGRMRPYFELNHDPHVFEPFGLNFQFHSIPSGHTTMVFCILALFSYFNKKMSYFWLPLACLIAFSRVVVHNHFLSDIIFGAFVGFYSTRYALKSYERVIFKKRRSFEPNNP